MTVPSEDAVFRVRRLIADDAVTALDDALADMLHVHDGDGQAVIDAAIAALPRAMGHYRAEKACEDGERVEVIR